METILIRRQVAAPVAVVWQALGGLCSSGTGLSVTAEVLGGQPPTLLSFRLLGGVPVRRNVVAVQLRAIGPGTTEVFVDGAFQPSLTGLGGRGRRGVRRVLLEVVDRLEEAVRTSGPWGPLPISAAAAAGA